MDIKSNYMIHSRRINSGSCCEFNGEFYMVTTLPGVITGRGVVVVWVNLTTGVAIDQPLCEVRPVDVTALVTWPKVPKRE